MLAALFGICFTRVLLGRESFFFRDFSLFGYPLAAHLHRCFWSAEFPLWNPFNNAGLPFLAQWNTMALYPGSLFFEILPLPWSVNVFCLGHLILGGFGLRRLVRSLTNDPFAADLAGLLFAFNGLALNFLMWPNNSAAWGWMPWLIGEFASRRAPGAAPGPTAWIRAATIATLQMLTGAPEVILFTWLVAGALAIAAGGWRLLLFALGVGCVTLLLAAPQLLPFIELWLGSHRVGGDFSTGDWALAPTGLLHFLAPLFESSPTGQGVHLQDAQKWTSSYYIGAATLGFCALGLRSNLGWLLGGLAAASLLLAHGVATIGLFRYPVKFVIPAVFCLIALAGLGAAQIPRLKNPRRACVVLCLALALAALAIAAIAPPNSAARLSAQTRALCALAGVVIAFVRFPFQTIALPALLALDIATHMPWQNPTIPTELLQPAHAGTTPRGTNGLQRSFLTLESYNLLRSRMLPDRTNDFLIRREALLQNLNLIDGLPKLDGFFSLYPMREREFRQALYLSPLEDVGPALDFLGVQRISRPGSVADWDRRTNALPIATIGQKPALAREGQILRAVLSPSFRPLETVYFHDRKMDAEEAASFGVSVQADRFPPSAHLTEIKAGRISIAVSNNAPEILVIAQSYDSNWRASRGEKFDGSNWDEMSERLSPLRTWRVNYNFLGVEAPAGVGRIVLEYRSRAFEIGLALAAAAMAVGFAFLAGKPRPS